MKPTKLGKEWFDGLKATEKVYTTYQSPAVARQIVIDSLANFSMAYYNGVFDYCSYQWNIPK
jgi:hypothetical protein